MYAATPYSGMATAHSPAGWRRTAKSFRRFGGGENLLMAEFLKRGRQKKRLPRLEGVVQICFFWISPRSVKLKDIPG
jgi:hypothetical protein